MSGEGPKIFNQIINMKSKALWLLSALLALSSISFAQNERFYLLVGTYTHAGGSEGIYVYEFNTNTGAMRYKTKVTVSNPSYLAVSPDRKFVYAVSEDKTSKINSFAFNSTTGVLSPINEQSSGGDGPTYVSVDASQKYVFAANYGGGSVSALPVEKDGSLGADIQVIKHEGSSLDTSRQDRPYAHSVVLTPDNQFLLAQDLGTDKVYIYRFDATKRPTPLSPAVQPFIKVAPGSGPRHLTFHPNGKFAYLINEVNSTITAFGYQKGHVSFLQTVSTLPEGFTGIGEPADIHVSPDGKFLYGSNRATVNDLVIYAINKLNGKLTFVGRQPTEGKESRTFSIDPTGNFLLAANGESNNITIFKRNKKTGLLSPLKEKIEIGSPTCFKFVKMD